MVNSNSTHVHSTIAVDINRQCETEVLLIDALSYVSKSTVRIELNPLNSVSLSSCPRPNVTEGEKRVITYIVRLSLSCASVHIIKWKRSISNTCKSDWI